MGKKKKGKQPEPPTHNVNELDEMLEDPAIRKAIQAELRRHRAEEEMKREADETRQRGEERARRDEAEKERLKELEEAKARQKRARGVQVALSITSVTSAARRSPPATCH